MSTIDEIMGRISRYAVAVCKAKTNREMSMLDDARDSLRDLIAAALADAERKGAEAMREAVDQLRADADEIFPPSDRGRQAPVEVRDVVEWYSGSIRALPLPTGSQS